MLNKILFFILISIVLFSCGKKGDPVYNEKNQICIGTYFEQESISISEFLSSDASALDKFIEKKLTEYGHSLDEKNKLNVNLNPNKDDLINKGQGAIILKWISQEKI